MRLTNVWTNRGKRAAEATRPDGNLDDLDEQSPRGWPAGDTHASRGSRTIDQVVVPWLKRYRVWV